MQKYKIGFVGLWHLGCVYSNVIASITDSIIIAYDRNSKNIKNLKKAKPPIFEPELEKLILSNLSNNKISFTDNPKALNTCDYVWITLDTELNENSDIGKYELVLEQIYEIIPFLKKEYL